MRPNRNTVLSRCFPAGVWLLPAWVLAAGGIATDGTMGEPGRLGQPRILEGGKIAIPERLGSRVGTNLFHSFAEFNIRDGQTVTFTEKIPGSLDNVISRITGNGGSNIDGKLRSTPGGHADFYLINPHGVTFGPNARIEVPAAFHIGTAAELRFRNGGKFSAVDPPAGTLSSASPSAFGFLATTSANNGLLKLDGARLQVKSGQTLDAVAGTIRIEHEAGLNAPAGEIRLVAQQEAGEVGLQRTQTGNLPLPEGRMDRAGSLDIAAGEVSVSGRGGGRIGIWGGDIAISENSLLSADNTGNTAAGIAAGVVLRGHSLRLDNSGISAGVNRNALGHAGPIEVEVQGDILLRDMGGIRSETYGRGNAGQVRVKAGGSLRVEGADNGEVTGIYSTAKRDSGNAGEVSVQAGGDIVLVNGGAEINSNTWDQGAGGQVRVETGGSLFLDARDSWWFTGISADAVDGAGHAGGVALDVGGNLSLANAAIVSSSAYARGNAGEVAIRVGGDIALGNGGVVTSNTYGAGQAGKVTVSAGNTLRIDRQDNTLYTGIATSAEEGSLGNAGSVNVYAGEAIHILDGGEISSSTFARGNGGDVAVSSGNQLYIDGQDSAYFTGIQTIAGTGGSGNAGNIAVESRGDIVLVNDGLISSGTSGPGRGGEVSLYAGNGLMLDGTGSQRYTGINSGAQPGSSGDAGDIVAGAGKVIEVKNGAEISSTTYAQGRAGGVTIQTGGTLLIDGKGGGYFTGIDTSAAPGSRGNAGPVKVTSWGDIVLRNGGAISTSTFARGGAGRVVVKSGGDLEIAGQDSPWFTGLDSRAESASSGDTGQVWVEVAGALTVADGGISSSTAGAGSAVGVAVRAATVRLGRGAEIAAAAFGPGSSGHTGIVDVDVGKLRIADGGNISIRNEAQAVNPDRIDPGRMEVHVREVTLERGGRISAMTSGNVDAGTILLNSTGTLALAREAEITSSTSGFGAAGDISIQAGRLLLDHARITAEAGWKSRGQAGSIGIRAEETIRMVGTSRISIANAARPVAPAGIAASLIRLDTSLLELDHSRITTQSDGTVAAGGIRLDVRQRMTLANASHVRTTANTGDGGPIRIRMRGNAGLWLADSAIETSVHGAGGDGGDIFVQAPALFLETGAIRANAISGHGGDIRLDVQNLAASGNRLNQREIGSGDPFAPELGRMAWKPYRFGDNVIQAVSYRGVNGTISLLAPQLNLSSVISNLGTPRFGEKLLTSDYCDVDNRSSLVLMGRGAPPRRSRDLQWLGD